MNAVHLTIAAGVVIPGVIATAVVVMPSDAERRAEQALEVRQAAIQRKVEEKDPQRFVLQPFYVPGGAFVFEVRAKGTKGLSALCSNLPVVHDAIVTQLDKDQLLYGKGAADYTPDGKQFRAAINAGFREPYVLDVDVTYHADTDVVLAGKRKVGSANRCLALKKSRINVAGD